MVTDFPLPVFLVVLLAALFHATWNALIRGGRDPLLHTAAIVFWAALLAVPFALLAGPPAPPSWPYLALSNSIHMLYYVSLAAAYRSGALSFAYPLIRGSAPLLVAVGAILFIGEAPGWLGWAGILLVSGGVLSIALRAEHPNPLPTVAWALLCAFTIAAYTLADGLGVRHAGGALGYSAWMFLLEGVLFPGGLALFGGGRDMAGYIRAPWRTGLLGGALSAAAYAIALWAMTQAPVALVAATRETSVLFASLLGVWALRERFSLRQWAGALAIAGGALLLRVH